MQAFISEHVVAIGTVFCLMWLVGWYIIDDSKKSSAKDRTNENHRYIIENEVYVWYSDRITERSNNFVRFIEEDSGSEITVLGDFIIEDRFPDPTRSSTSHEN